ncbi:MAG: H-NS histone family protein [Rhodoferax sp.]
MSIASLQDIQSQIAALQKKAEEIKAQEFNNGIADILAKMDALGITVQDIEQARGRGPRKAGTKSASKSANPAPIKFRGPAGETWSGRGLMPRWLRALEAQGRKKEDFAV